MTREKETEIEARLAAIRAQMEATPAMLDGTLLTKHNRTARKDGSIRVSPEYYTFQYLGVDGKRKWKRIPKGARAAVERLVCAGTRYRKLVREYTALMNETSLAGAGKKNA
jgi:hypothetical protein